MNEAARALELLSKGGYKKEEIQAGDRTVVYITNDGGNGFPPNNNLFILDAEEKIVWEMSRVLKRPDTAVLMKVEDGILYFTTFCGLHFGINVATLDVTEKRITK